MGLPNQSAPTVRDQADVEPETGRLTIEAVALAAVAFLVYAWGAARVIYVGDSGELTTAAAILGIPHPSGYPLYVLLGHLWIRLVPFLTPAHAMSLFSAFAAAVAVGALYAVVARSTASRLAGGLAAALLAFSPSFWSQANVQRVYSLNAAFIVLALGCAWLWFRTRRDPWMVLAALITGLGAANHTAMALVGVSIGVCAVLADAGWIRRAPKCVLAATIGLLPYLYLPVRSRQDPLLDWGNPETLAGFWHTVTRRSYWDRRWIESPADLLPISWDWLLGLGQEFFVVGALLGALGVWVAPRFGWPRLLLPLVLLTNLGSMALHGSRSDLFVWHRYYIPSYVAMALLAGLGAAFLRARFPVPARVLVLLPVLMLVDGWPRFDRSDHRFADQFSRELLENLPPNAVLSANDDSVFFPLIYLQLVEEVRPDVTLLMQGVQDQAPGGVRLRPEETPIFFTHAPSRTGPQIEVQPVGLVFQVTRSGQSTELLDFDDRLDGEFDPRIPKDLLTRHLIAHFHFMIGVTYERRDWTRAARHWRRASELARDGDVHFYNMGLIYRRNGLPARALDAFQRSAAIHPRRLRGDASASVWVERMQEEVARQERLVRAVRADLGIGSADESAQALWRIAWELVDRGEPLLARGFSLRALEAESAANPLHPDAD